MLVRRNRQTNHVPKIVGLASRPGDGVEIGKDNSLKINKMNEQLNLFDTVNEATNPACFIFVVTKRFLLT